MKTKFAPLFWVVVLTFFIGFSSCATSGFQAFGACSTAVLKATGQDLMTDLAAVFATGSYEAEVAKILIIHTPAEVACAVDLLISELSSKKSLSVSGSVTLTNAKTWRAKHPRS